MNTLMWLLDSILVPLAEAFYPVFDLLLGVVFRLPPIVDIICLGAFTGFFVNLFVRYYSDQDWLRAAKADLETLSGLRKAGGDVAEKERLDRLTGRISGTYAWRAVIPSLWTIPFICLLAMWMGARLSVDPVRPGDVLEVVARFADGATGLIHVLPGDLVRPEGSAISRIEAAEPASGTAGVGGKIEARWRIRFPQEGTAKMRFRYREDDFLIEFPVARTGVRPPDLRFPFPPKGPSPLQELQLGLKPRVAAAWWNLTLGWAGVYILAAIVFGLGFRRLLDVQ